MAGIYYPWNLNNRDLHCGITMNLRNLVVELIRKIDKGKTIETRRIQSAICSKFPDDCERLGLTPTAPVEEKWRKDIRFALQDAKSQGLIKHIGLPKSGLWQRI